MPPETKKPHPLRVSKICASPGGGPPSFEAGRCRSCPAAKSAGTIRVASGRGRFPLSCVSSSRSVAASGRSFQSRSRKPPSRRDDRPCRRPVPADVSSRDRAPEHLLFLGASAFGGVPPPFSVGRRKILWDVVKLCKPDSFSVRRRRNLRRAAELCGPPSESLTQNETRWPTAKLCGTSRDSPRRRQNPWDVARFSTPPPKSVGRRQTLHGAARICGTP